MSHICIILPESTNQTNRTLIIHTEHESFKALFVVYPCFFCFWVIVATHSGYKRWSIPVCSDVLFPFTPDSFTPDKSLRRSLKRPSCLHMVVTLVLFLRLLSDTFEYEMFVRFRFGGFHGQSFVSFSSAE